MLLLWIPYFCSFFVSLSVVVRSFRLVTHLPTGEKKDAFFFTRLGECEIEIISMCVRVKQKVKNSRILVVCVFTISSCPTHAHTHTRTQHTTR